MKSKVTKFIIILVSIMVVSFVAAGIIFYATGGISAISISSPNIHTSETYKAAGVERIVIKTVNTDINVIPAVINRVDVDFYGNIKTNLAAEIPKLKTGLDNGILSIEITQPRTINIGLINLSQLQLDVYVPNDYKGEIMVATVSGDLNIHDLGLARLDFTSTSADIESDSVTAGDFSINTSSGDVLMKNMEGMLDINTISGDVKAGIKELKGNIYIKTISGDMLVALPGQSEFDFTFSSVSGDILNQFGAQIDFAENGKMEGFVGEGDYKITAETVSGDITIEKEGKENE